MTGTTVAVVGSAGVAQELGKKGTTSDLTLYNSAHDGHAVTLVEPTQFPDKFAPLLVALAMADHAFLVVGELTRPVAETIAVVDLAEVPTTIVLGPGVGEPELAKVLRGSRLETAPRLPLDLPTLRAAVDALRVAPVDGPVEVPIDHAFPVKGVGAVALGVVRRGTLHAHDRLRLHPTAKEVEVRSIQVHDADRKDAETGERVGVALRGVDADELVRGQTLAPADALRDDATVVGSAWRKCRYYRGDAGVGAQVHLGLGLQVVPASIEALGDGGVRVTADRPVGTSAGRPGFLVDLSVPAGPRIAGRFTTG